MRELEIFITSKSIGKSYKVSIDDDFALNFEKDLKELTYDGKFLDAKNLLEAFVKTSYENFKQLQTINELINQIKEVEYEKRF